LAGFAGPCLSLYFSTAQVDDLFGLCLSSAITGVRGLRL
jgi:hypothetical protein